MTVLIRPLLLVPAAEVSPAGDIEIRMVWIDAGVENRDVERDLKRNRVVAKCGESQVGFGAIDPGWKILDVDHVYFVELDRGDPGITSESAQTRGWDGGREAKQRGSISMSGDETKLLSDGCSARMIGRSLAGSEPAMEDDDHVGRSGQRKLGLGWGSRSTGFAARGDRESGQRNEEKTFHGAPRWESDALDRGD